MKAQKILNVVANQKPSSVNIPANSAKNKERQYLYNEVLDLIKECRVPAVISNHGIKLPSPSTQILNRLNETGIHFETII